MEIECEKCFFCYSLNSGTYKSLFVILNERQMRFTLFNKICVAMEILVEIMYSFSYLGTIGSSFLFL